MKKLFFIICLTPLFFNAQKKQRINELKEILKNSYYVKINNIKDIDWLAKKYACIEKYYKYDVVKEKEFLTEKEFKLKYPYYDPEFDKDEIHASILQEAYQPYQFYNNESVMFPKCIKKKETSY